MKTRVSLKYFVSYCRFVTKKWIEIYDQSENNYSINKKIRTKTSMLRSDLCDFSDAHIILKGDKNCY